MRVRAEREGSNEYITSSGRGGEAGTPTINSSNTNLDEDHRELEEEGQAVEEEGLHEDPCVHHA